MTQIYLLVLLCHHACPESKDLFFCSEPKKNMKKHRIWDIKAAKQALMRILTLMN